MSSERPLIPGPLPRTAAWYEARQTHFGASEAHDVVMQPLAVYAKKVSGVEEPDNPFMMVGRYVEPAIGGIYEETKGIAPLVGDQPMFFHPEIEYLAATPDFAAPDNQWVEAKYSMSPAIAAQLGEPGSDWVPDKWAWQVQQQIDVLEVEKIDIAVLIFAQFRVYTVERDDRLIHALHTSAAELWDRIQNLDPPEPKPNTGALAAAKAAFNWEEDVVVELDEECLGFWTGAQDAKEKAKALKQQAEYLEAVVLHRIGDAARGRFPQGEYEVARTKVQPKLWTEDDVVTAQQKIGQIKRKGHIRLGQRKIRK